MTVINAMKFDFYRGALVCDEQTMYGEARYAFHSDKIKNLIPPAISREFGVIAAYGASGTQSVAAEVIKKTCRELELSFQDMKSAGLQVYPYSSIEAIARFAMKKMLEVKHQHLNDKLYSLFHFELDDFNRGFYETDRDKIEIKQENIIDRATDLITWKDYNPDVEAIFKNRALIAGFDPVSGFEMYTLDLIENECFFSGSLFESVGSGADVSIISLDDFINTKVLSKRREKIDPLEGIIELIRATNASARQSCGVGGYFNIVLIDGRKPHNKRYHEIMDHHARLASEIVFAFENGLISNKDVYELINNLIFGDAPFAEMEEDFSRRAKDPRDLNLLLRGYKIESIK